MKLYYLAYSKDAPSVRYRGKYLLQEIRARYGTRYRIISPILRDLPTLLFLFLRNLLHNDKENFYIVQKISTRGIYSSLVSTIVMHSRRNCYDIDDAMYAFRDKGVIDFFIARSRSVVVASNNLLEYSEQLNPNTHLITTPVTDPCVTKFTRNKSLFVVGWIGIYKVHKESLQAILFPALERLGFPIILRLIGVDNEDDKDALVHLFIENKNVRLELTEGVDWEDEMQIQKNIVRFDVGVMPLLDTEIGRSKSAFKLKQYLSCGVPVLASDIGDNAQFVENKKNGYLCRTTDEWAKHIIEFQRMTDREFQSFCKAAHTSYTASGYTLKKVSQEYMKVIQEREYIL